MTTLQTEKCWLIVQQGGSSLEWYPSTYDTREEAEAAIHEIREATYDAIGPYEIELAVTEAKLIGLLATVCRDVATIDTELCENYLEWLATDEGRDA